MENNLMKKTYTENMRKNQRELFDSFKRFETRGSVSKMEFLDTLTLIIKQARENFIYEEEIMDYYNYPKSKKHIESHEVFISQVADWLNVFNDMPLIVPYKDIKELIVFGNAWLTVHIREQDYILADYLFKRGK